MNVNNRYNFKDISMGRQKRTAFDISESKTFDCYPGSVIPAYVRYMNPGDTFKIKNRLVVRANPLISPAYVKMEAVSHTFFVPFRTLWPDWEPYLTKGVSGDFTADIPRMITTSADNANSVPFYKHSFWDYMGLPIPNFNFETGFDQQASGNLTGPYVNVDLSNISQTDIPHNFAYSAYNFIYNEFYRDENLSSPRAYLMLGQGDGTIKQGEATNPLDLDNPFFKYKNFLKTLPIYSLEKINGVEPTNSFGPTYVDSIFQVTYKKDYFTSALPFQQRGDAPAIPITSNYILSDTVFTDLSGNNNQINFTNPAVNLTYKTVDDFSSPDTVFIGGTAGSVTAISGANFTKELANKLENNTTITSFSMSVPELYLLTSLQKWQQISARGGVRLNEFLLAMYGISPTDAVLQRPQYLGGLRSPIMISEVAQTSQSTNDSELGQLAGYGLSATENFIDSYTAREHGVLMTLFFITYQPNYPTAIDRELLNSSVYDWYFPTFTNLADQAILSREIYLSNDSSQNETIFGYQGKYDELRTSFNKVAGSLRTNELGNWTASRRFTSAPALNNDFLTIKKDSLKDLFQVQDQPPFIVYFDTHCEAIRPLPYHSNPSLEV